MVLGDAWLSAGKPRDAIAAYRQAVRLAPRRRGRFARSPPALRERRSAGQAADVLKRALASRRRPVTWHRSGMLDLASDELRRVEKIRKAIELDPSLPDQSRTLAEILYRNPGNPTPPGPPLATPYASILTMTMRLGFRRPRARRKRRNGRVLLRLRTGGPASSR